MEIKWNDDAFKREIGAKFDKANRQMEHWSKRNPGASESAIASQAKRAFGSAGLELSRGGRDYAREVVKRRSA